jgi:DNA-binding transcriptional ArsR family regulator
MLGILDTDDMAVGVIAEQLGLAQPTISQHLRVLSNVQLVDVATAGRERRYRTRPDGLTPIAQWLITHDYWNQRLDALGVFLEEN